MLLCSRARVYKPAPRARPRFTYMILVSWKSATSPSSPMSTMARPRWSTSCSSSPAPCARTSTWPSAPWTPTTRSASAASPSWPNARRWNGTARASTSSTRPAMPISAARWSASSPWWTASCCWSTRPKCVMPQTKFVLSKALKLGLKPIVVINKIDRSDAQPKETLESIFDLFLALEANDDQLEFSLPLRLGPQGWAVEGTGGRAQESRSAVPARSSTTCRTPKPHGSWRATSIPFKMLVTTLEADNYLGRVLTGRIESGAITINRKIKALTRDGEVIEKRPRHQAAGLPRPGARAGGAGRSRRHRRHCRP